MGPSQTLHFDTNEPNDDLASLFVRVRVANLGYAIVWIGKWMEGGEIKMYRKLKR